MRKKLLIIPTIVVLVLSAFVVIQIQTANAANFTYTTLTKPIQAAGVASDGTLYAGTFGTVYKSTDRGQTWSSALISISNADDISCIFVAQNGYIYFSPVGGSVGSSYTGLWRSTNQGQSWTRVLTLPTSECIWGIDQDTNGNLYAGVYTLGDANSDARIYKSTNNGASWSSAYYDSSARHVHCVRVDKSNNYIYAAVGDSMAPWNINYVLRSTNGGSSWSKILTSMPQVVAIEAASGARFFGSDAGTGRVFKTTDDSSYSTVLDTGTYSNFFWIRKSDLENKLIAGLCAAEGSPRSGGIYVSTDSGSTWTLGESLPANQAYDGTTAVSNYVGGIIYHDVVLNGAVRNGECLNSGNPSPTSTPTATPTPTPTPSPTPTPTPLPLPVVQIKANVTVTAVNFNQTTTSLNVTIIKNGTNSLQAVISKTSLPSITNFKVFVNNVQTTYEYASNSTYWQVTFKTT